MTHVDRDRVVAALEEDWAALLDLLAGLAPGDWGRPTDCPGWSVQDHVSHVVGLEAMLEGRPLPDVELGDTTHIRNDLGRLNELWVESTGRGRRPRCCPTCGPCSPAAGRPWRAWTRRRSRRRPPRRSARTHTGGS